MLRAAMAMVNRTGLTVSLDHISFEDVIRDADVSRSAVYRRWPFKDLFFSDLVKELAANATPTIVADELELIRRGAWTGWKSRRCGTPCSSSCSASCRCSISRRSTGHRSGGPTSLCTRRS
jgi:AcrR family transcriptional regulator